MSRTARGNGEMSACAGADLFHLIGKPAAARWSRWWMVSTAALALVACGDAREASGRAPGVAAPEPKPFVLFTESRLVLGRVGETAQLPTAVGSTVNGSTVVIGDPSVVALIPTGHLHALREGSTTVTAVADAGQALMVEVVDARSVALVPDRLKLLPGGAGEFLLFDRKRGTRLEPSSVRWSTSAPDVAVVIEGRVQAGDAPGRAVVSASLEGREFQALVEVAARPGKPLTVQPANPRIRVGEPVSLVLTPGGAPSSARWTVAEGPTLLHQSGPATFVGTRPGRARVCATQGGTACTSITITK